MKSELLAFRLAMAGIFENKARTFLTMLGIIIGVASVIAIIAIGAGAQSLITGSIQKMGTNLVGVLPGASSDKGPPSSALGITITTLTYDDAMAIKQLPHVAGISAYANGNGEITYGRETEDGTFSGVTADYPAVENHPVEVGRFYTDNEERTAKKVAVLGSEMKDKLFPYTNPIGEKIRVKNEKFTIIGVLKKKGSSLVNNPDNQVFIPLSAVQKILLGQHHLGLIRIKVDEEQYVPVVMESIAKLLRYRHRIDDPIDDDFSIRSLSQALDTLKAVTDGLKFFLASIAAISLIVGGIGITNIMLMTVKERTREIGLKKAIGAKRTQIRNQFLLEALVVTGCGGLIGIIFGAVISYLIALIAWKMQYTWVFSISPFSIVISLVVSIGVGVIFGMYPAQKAAKMNPIQALRYE